MTVEITPELLSDLEAKAKAAAPGPWSVIHNDIVSCGYHPVAHSTMNERQYICNSNAAHIAAASPDVVLALVAELRTREKMCTWLAESFDDHFSCPHIAPCEPSCVQCALKMARNKAVEESDEHC